MAYTHSWEWDDKIVDPKKFARWCGDVLVLLAYYNENPLPNPYKEEPWIWFPRTSIPDWNTTICGPAGSGKTAPDLVYCLWYLSMAFAHLRLADRWKAPQVTLGRRGC
jgi:hypothetical protein